MLAAGIDAHDVVALPQRQATRGHKPGSSDPRNETIMKMLSMVEIGERAGSNMGKIHGGSSWAGYDEPATK
jgi:hypothetical protein